jgi:hypothetical protein
MNMDVQAFLFYSDILSFGYMARSGIEDHIMFLFLVFAGTSILISIMAALIYISTNSV